MHGTGRNDAWAVGLYGAALHWDGELWSRSETPSDATLWSVWSAAPDDAWAVGGALLHWNGERWLELGSAL
jgi:hypothetical protein